MKKEKEIVSGSNAGDIGGGEFKSSLRDIKDVLESPFSTPLLSVFLGTAQERDAELLDCSLDKTGFGDFALLNLRPVDNGGEAAMFRCNSDAVVDQVKKLQSHRDLFPVLVHVVRKRNKSGQEYYSLLG